MKIVLPDAKTVTNGDIDLRVFEKYGEVAYYPLTSADELPSRIADADAVICNKSVFTKEVFDAASRLKYIGLFATGYNNIDIPAALAHGVTVCNAGSYSTAAVAQHTFALILEHFGNISEYKRFCAKGKWTSSPTFSPFVFPMHELDGKTIGIIGYGSIGKTVAKIALAFGMRVLVYTRTPKDDPLVSFVDLETLVSKSDVITVHCPLNDASRGMFNEELFAKCKSGAYFVNTSRGPVADERALRAALDSGRLSGAGVDVLESEPMREDCPLFGAKNITITPHIAWAPIETRERLLGIVVDCFEAFLSGKPKNVITK